MDLDADDEAGAGEKSMTLPGRPVGKRKLSGLIRDERPLGLSRDHN
jgi:hypothetical protein